MLTQNEREEIRQVVYDEIAELESQIVHAAGSYRYLCRVQGLPTFTHHPIGQVLRQIYHGD